MKKRLLAILLVLATVATVLCACKNPAPSGDGSAAATTAAGSYRDPDATDPETGLPLSLLRGVNFFPSSAKDRKLELSNLILLTKALGAGSVRLPFGLPSLLTAEGELKQKQVEQTRLWLEELRNAGVYHAVGFGRGWLFPSDSAGTDSGTAPVYDDAENSEYRRWLALYEESWYAVATAFPEIGYWEIGNGIFEDENLHPASYRKDGKTFADEDKIEILAGLCAAASAGIHRANANATVLVSGFAVRGGNFTAAVQRLSKLCQYITGGFGTGSTKRSDYFGAVAWQYYPDATWSEAGMKRGVEQLSALLGHGADGAIPLLLTECGMSDGGEASVDAWQADTLEALYRAATDGESGIGGLFFYRLTDDANESTSEKQHFGLFRVLGKRAFEAKEKARAVCRAYGGNAELLDQFRDLTDPPEDEPTDAREKIVSYLCTWGRQAYVASKLGISGSGSSQMRDALTADTLFGSKNYYHTVPQEYRSKLIFLLDDGWDVPKGTSQDGARAEFGSMEPDPVKFGSLGSTPVERLTAMVEKTKALGYAGLGLWVSPQIPYETWTPTEQAREYWTTRAKQSAAAGVCYWKVDWGKHQSDTAYRQMITDCAKQYAPDLIVEHAYTQTPFTDSNTEENFKANRRAALKEYVLMSGTVRIYDLSAPFETVCALDRIDEIFSLYEETGSGADVYVNAESQAYIAAVLGCSLGIMTYNTEMRAALNWMLTYAPAFSAKDATYRSSDTTLTDSFYFDRDVADWFQSGNRTMTETAPAVMARGCELPEVVTRKGMFTPFVAASVNPITGAASIGCFRRTVDPNQTVAGIADVTFRVGKDAAPIGVFGMFGSLTLVMEEDYSDGVKVLAQDLLGTDAEDISAYVTVDGNRITIDGTVLRRIGKSARTDGDSSDPSLILRISHNS